MKWSFLIARVRGIDIRVHITFGFVLLFGAVRFSELHGLSGAWFGALFMCLLFACVVLHELGHSLVAQQLGVPVREILLLPIGGVAKLGRDPKTPLHELLIAVAGPLVNVALAVLGLAAASLMFGPSMVFTQAFLDPGGLGISGAAMLSGLIGANVVLAVFNLVPALPMDGGRVLRALMAFVIGHPRATKVSALLGQAIALAIVAFAVHSGEMLLLLIGVVVFLGAGAERHRSRAKALLQRYSAEDACPPSLAELGPSDSLKRATECLLRAAHSYLPVTYGGNLVGIISRASVLAGMASRGESAFVGGAMQRHFTWVEASTSLTVVEEMLQAGQGIPVAVRKNGSFVGIIGTEDLNRVSAMAARLARPPRT